MLVTNALEYCDDAGMERNHIPMQTNQRFGFAQSSGAQYRPDAGQNLSTPGQTLPPPPPLVRHGHTSSVTTSTSDDINAALEELFRRSLNPYPSTSIGVGNGTSGHASMGSSMGSNSTPSQSNPRLSFPGTQSGAQQYSDNWAGQGNNVFVRMPGTMPRVPGDPVIRQGLRQQLAHNLPMMPQDKHMNYGIGQNTLPDIAGGGYTYGGYPDRLSTPGMTRERMNSNFNCRMPGSLQQNGQSNMRQTVPNYPSNFSQPSSGYGLNTNQFSVNQGMREPPLAHQSTPRVPPSTYQHQRANLPSQGQSHTTVNPRAAHVSNPYGVGPNRLFGSQPAPRHMTPTQSPYGSQSTQGHTSPGQAPFGSHATQGNIPTRQSPFSSPTMQGHISPGQNQVRMSSGHSNIATGQGHYVPGSSSRNQNGLGSTQGQGNSQGHGQSQTGSVNGQGFLAGWQQHEGRFSPEGFQNIADAAKSLSQLADNRQNTATKPAYRLLQLKEGLDLLEKQGMLGPGETADAVLAGYVFKEKGRQQQVLQTSVVQTHSSSTVTVSSSPKLRQADASAILSAFAIPASHEAHDKAVLGRWYAPPSSETNVPSQTPGRSSSIPPINTSTVGPATTTETAATTTSTGNSGITCSVPSLATTEPFVLRPTVCTEDNIEYKVADLLRCLPQKVRSRHTSSVDSAKSTEPSVSDINANHEKSTPMSNLNDKSLGSSSAVNVSKPTLKVSQKVPGKVISREITPDPDEQMMETESLLDFSKKQVLDRLVLDSQFGTQDMNPEIDFRNYLPSLGFPADFAMTPSPVMNAENPSIAKTNSQVDNVSPQNHSEKLSAPDQTNTSTQQDKEIPNEKEGVPEPSVEVDRDEIAVPLTDETPVQLADETPGELTDETPGELADEILGQLTDETPGQLADETPGQHTDETAGQLTEETPGQLTDETPVLPSKKRKHSTVSDSNLGKLTPQVKRKRGTGQGRGQGQQQRGGARGRGRGRGRGKAWAVNLTPNNKQTKAVRGVRRQTARRGRGSKRKITGSVSNDSPVIAVSDTSEQLETHSRVSGFDGQVIQKAQDLKALMDNLPHEELEKATVSLSTLKMMLAWQEAKTSAGPDDVDQESDTASIASVSDAPKVTDTENMDTEDVTSEKNNKEHNIYEPPNENVEVNENEKSEKDPSDENVELNENEKSEKENEVSSLEETKNQDRETSAEKPTGKNNSTAVVEMDTQNEKELDTGNQQNCIGKLDNASDDKTSDISNEKKTNEPYNTTDVCVESKEKQKALKANTKPDESESKTSNVDSRLATQIYLVTDTHKMTWVRYHGRTVTRLITPNGNFFIFKEIVRRCFRIQEPNKSLKFSKIGILKRKVLKIPDIELEPLFYDYVVKNLVDRKVIKTVPDVFIIISEEDANRLFHYVCKDKYCGSACVTPFFQKQTQESTLTSEDVANSDAAGTGPNINTNNSNLPQTKCIIKKDRNLFDFLESEASPKLIKTIKKSPDGKKRQKHPSNEVINLCSDEDGSNGYDSDKTLPYVDGKPVPFDELENLEKSATKSPLDNEHHVKGKRKCIEKSPLAAVANSEKERDCERRNYMEGKDKSKPIKETDAKSEDFDLRETLSPGYSEGETKLSKCNTVVTATLEKGTSANVEYPKESAKHTENIQSEGEGKSESQGISSSDKNKKNVTKHVSECDVIVIDDDDDDDDDDDGEENLISVINEVGLCKLTLDRMKKEISSEKHVNSKNSEGQSEELVQVNNIDSTAVSISGYSIDNQNTGMRLGKKFRHSFDGFDKSNDKQKDGGGEVVGELDKGISDKEKSSANISITDLSAISDSCLNDVDSVIASDRTNEDVIVGEWIFPAPPKNYPEDGTKKLEEASETLEKIIERANNAKKTEDYVDILDNVFKLTEPLKQWTNTLLDHYEEGLLIEAQRLKSLDQLKLKDISNTIDLDDDVEMESPRVNDSG